MFRVLCENRNRFLAGHTAASERGWLVPSSSSSPRRPEQLCCSPSLTICSQILFNIHTILLQYHFEPHTRVYEPLTHALYYMAVSSSFPVPRGDLTQRVGYNIRMKKKKNYTTRWLQHTIKKMCK